MKMRRFFAAALAATTLLGTALPTMADTTTSYPNLTVYDTPYTTVVSDTSAETSVNLMACGATAKWEVGFLSEAEVNDVEWKILSGGAGGVTIADTYPIEMDTDQYIAYADVRVAAGANNGITVVEAYNSQGGYVDFTISVKNTATAVQSVTGVKNVFYDATGTTETKIGEVGAVTVDVNNHYGNSNYPCVLDAPMAALLAPDSIVGNYSIVSNYGTYTLKTFVLKNVTYDSDLNDYTKPGWQYRVYDASGKMVEISEKVAADDCPLSNGCTIVWKYGTYAGTTFSATL